MKINKNLEEIILLLEEERFLFAQEKFEKLWRDYKDNINTREESFILKAFVNASVFFEIYKMDKYKQALNLWKTYKKYEYLIKEIKSSNKKEYKKIQEIIYKKKEKLINDNFRF